MGGRTYGDLHWCDKCKELRILLILQRQKLTLHTTVPLYSIPVSYTNDGRAHRLVEIPIRRFDALLTGSGIVEVQWQNVSRVKFTNPMI